MAAKTRRPSKKERQRISRWVENWQQKWRNRYKEIHGKTLDFVTYSYEDNLLFINLYFSDKTNFSLDFSLREPAIEPYAIEYGDVSTGDYENIKTYFVRKR